MDLDSKLHRAGAVALVAALVGVTAASGQPASARTAPNPTDVFNQISSLAPAKLGHGYGCVAKPGGDQLVLLVTSKPAVKAATRIVTGLHASGLVKVRVINPRYSWASLLAIGRTLTERVGSANPDVVLENMPDDSGHRSCGVVHVSLSSAAPAWVTDNVTSLQQSTAGADRLKIDVLPPEQMPHPAVPAL